MVWIAWLHLAACDMRDSSSTTSSELACSDCSAFDTQSPLYDGDGDGWSEEYDCDDANVETNPAAYERCDGQDNDCDGEVDEGVTVQAWYDFDHDGYGDPRRDQVWCIDELPGYYKTNDLDCDDHDADINPAAPETCDGVDNNCDGVTDEGCDTASGGAGTAAR